MMKSYLSKTKIAALALTAFLTTSLTAPVFANPGGKGAEIVCVGNLDNRPVYRLSLNNKVNEVYFVSITDNNGNLINNEKVTGENIVRNYQFENDIYGEYDLTFTISTPKGKTIGAYNVSKTKKTIEEVTINKIK